MLDDLKMKCAKHLVKGNLTINEETGEMTVNLSKKGKKLLVEYAIQSIVLEALLLLDKKTK